MIEKTIGFALTGSFCTFQRAIEVLKVVKDRYGDVYPIMSEKAANTDTRFGKASEFIKEIETICERTIIKTIENAEPIGPKAFLDILVIAPCTGNTIAKIASGITDSSVSMAAKAHLRNDRPLLLAVSTNDGLSGNAANIGLLLNRKNVYFVPYYQDDPVKKPNSLISDFEKIPEAIEDALSGKQIQPLLTMAE